MDVGRSTPAAPAVPSTLAALVAGLFRLVARLRGGRRALHPRGVVLRGRARILEAGSGLGTLGADLDAVVRLSRGAGLPARLPDVNGIALRLLDAHGPGRHQDLLLASAPSRRGLRHTIRPAVSFSGTSYSSVLPHRDRAGRRWVFGSAPLAVDRLDDVERALPLTLTVLVARPLGTWLPAAELHLTASAPDLAGVRFDPWVTGSELTPAGFLNRLRDPAYAGSRAGS